MPVATKALRLLEYAEYSLSTFERSFANTCALSAAIDARRLDWAVRQLLAQPLRRLTVFGARGAFPRGFLGNGCQDLPRRRGRAAPGQGVPAAFFTVSVHE